MIGGRKSAHPASGVVSSPPSTDPRELLPGGVFQLRQEGAAWSVRFVSARLRDLFDLRDATIDAGTLLGRIHPDDRAGLLAAAAPCAAQGTTWRMEVRIEHPTRGASWVEWEAEPCPDASGVDWHGVARDTTARRLAQGRAELLAAALDRATDSAFLLDRDARIVYVNQGACRVLGYSAEELVGQTPVYIDPVITPGDLDRLSLETHTNRTASVGTWHRTRDGRVFPVEVSAAAIDHEGRPYTIVIARDMTRKRELLEKLTRSEREYRSLAEHLPDQVLRLDREGRFVYINPALEHVLGHPLADLVGTPITDLHRAVKEAAAEVVRTAAPRNVRQAVIVDGDPRVHDVRLVPELDDRGAVAGVLAIGRDVTDMLRAQELIAVREQEFRSLAEGAPVSIIRYDEAGRIRYLNARLARELDVEPGDVVGRRPHEVWPDGRYDAIEAASRQAVLTGETNTVEFWAVMGGARCHQVHIVPELDESGRRIGALAFGLDVTEARRFGRLLQLLFDALPDLVWLKGRDGRYLAGNRRVAALLATDEASLIGKSDDDFFDAATADANRAHDDAARGSGLPTRHVGSVRFADGHHELLETVRVLVRDGLGLETGVLGIARDVTERQRATDALQAAHAAVERSLKEVRSLAENIPDCVVRWDADGRCLYINPAGERLLGIPAEGLAGRTLHEVCPDGRLAALEQTVTRVLSTGVAELFLRQPLRGTDGLLRTLDTSLVPELDATGRVTTVLGISRDLTEVYKLQDAVMTSERRFRHLVTSMPDLVAQFDRQGRRTFANAAWHRFVADAEDPGVHSGFVRTVHEVVATGEAKEWELDLAMRGGGQARIDIRGVPEFGPEGGVTGVLTVARDITQRRAIEDQQRMAASVFGAAREGIVITDPEGRILDVNPAFSRITGYGRDEVIAQNPRILASGSHDRAFYERMWSALRAGRSWSGEITNRRKSGETYVEHLDIVAVPDERGAPRHFVGIFSDVTVLKEHQRHLHHIAHHDALTGLPNRLLLTDRLAQAIAEAKAAGSTLAVLYLDLDGFKPVNDLHGHDVGDHVLCEIASRLGAAVRPGDTVARIGGDEFVILMVDVGAVVECEAAANRILACVNRPIEVGELRLGLSASIGISLYPEDQVDDADILLRYADQAMYAAKASGRNQYLFHANDGPSTGLGNRRMLHDLRRALTEGQIWVAFQPIVDLASGRVVKAEALARWTHPEHGPVSPGEFIPIAEAGGMIQAIGDHVFERSAHVTRRWNLALADGLPRRISVNRSPRQFFHRDGVAAWLRLLETLEVRGEWLGIEITEGLLLEDRDDVMGQLLELRRAGLSVSLDDFGTGYSALSYLKKFQIDYLKIDRSFVRDIVEDPNDRAIVEAVIAMARHLRIRVIAEGVETPQQAALLTAEGCDLAQGYLYARPMPEEEFLSFVLRHA